MTGIFGVGAKTADRWIREGIYNLEQLRHSGQTLNRAQTSGLLALFFLAFLNEDDFLTIMIRAGVCMLSPL